MLTKWEGVWKPLMLRQAQHERLPHAPTDFFRIIAGPIGAGKTTFALEYLPQVAQCSRFVNADLIAAGLSPLAPERELLAASRLFLAEIDARIQQREDFAFETTLAGRSGYQFKAEQSEVKPFVVSLSNHERLNRPPFDKLRANG